MLVLIKKHWGEHISLVEFYYNSMTHSVMKMSSFELMLGKESMKSMDLTIPMGQRDHSKEIVDMAKGRDENNA